jgi:hypothetical protein
LNVPGSNCVAVGTRGAIVPCRTRGTCDWKSAADGAAFGANSGSDGRADRGCWPETGD